jgi:propionyl-CoA synthetase
MSLQDTVHKTSRASPESFWSYHAQSIDWHRQPSRALKQTKPATSRDSWTWFPDALLSTTHNCVDRHVEAGHGDNIAIIWESAVTGEREEYTYLQLQDEVEVLAGVLREEGVRRGDVVIIYSTYFFLLISSLRKEKADMPVPMIPPALIAALAIARLGAIHAAVFGGFAAPSLASRIEAAKPRAIMTASCGIEGSKGPLAYRPLVEEAIRLSAAKPEKVIVWQREPLRWNRPDKLSGQRNWQRIVKSARMRGVKAAPVPIRSEEALYIIYTSGMPLPVACHKPGLKG